MKCGEKIKYYRELVGMSQEELAQRTGYAGRSAISRIESGARDISQSKIKMFARVLGVEAINLVDDREPITQPRQVDPRRKKLHDFVDQLPEEDLPLYGRVLDIPKDRLEAIVRLLE